MKMRTVVFLGALAAFTTPAMAGHCPVDVRAIDAALANNPTLSATELALVVALRDHGNAAPQRPWRIARSVAPGHGNAWD